MISLPYSYYLCLWYSTVVSDGADILLIVSLRLCVYFVDFYYVSFHFIQLGKIIHLVDRILIFYYVDNPPSV